MTIEELHWLVGFYEAEGHCSFYLSKSWSYGRPTKDGSPRKKYINLNKPMLTVGITQKHKPVCEMIFGMLKFGHVTNSGYTCFRWGANSALALRFIDIVLPHMRHEIKIQQITSARESYLQLVKTKYIKDQNGNN